VQSRLKVQGSSAENWDYDVSLYMAAADRVSVRARFRATAKYSNCSVAVYCRSQETYTDVGFWRDIISAFLVLVFIVTLIARSFESVKRMLKAIFEMLLQFMHSLLSPFS